MLTQNSANTGEYIRSNCTSVVIPAVNKKSGKHILSVIASFALLMLLIAGTGFLIMHKQSTIAGYAAPLKSGIALSANFGEIRPGHKHMGLDIRTNGKENMEVRSVADGYVSRVGVSASGYGKVIYITHNNNRTSVYAHLNEFYSVIEDAVLDRQLKSKSREQDILFAKGRFPVTKNMLIGLSGNTGHSEGPHLHFEWRDTKSGASLNPQKELFRLNDGIAPVIEELLVYDPSAVSAKGAIARITNPSINRGKQIVVNVSAICFGVSAVDKMNNNQFNLGTYKISVFDNSELIFETSKDSINQNHILSLQNEIDYRLWYKSGVFAEYLFTRNTGADATILRRQKKTGIVDLSDKKSHHIVIRAVDLGGNASEIEFDIRSGNTGRGGTFALHGQKVKAGVKSVRRSGNWVFDFMIGSLFDDIGFNAVHKTSLYPSSVSETITVGDPAVALKDSLKVTLKLKDPANDHSVFVLSNDVFYDVIRPLANLDRVSCSLPVFGDLTLVNDRVAPVIGLVGWRNHGKLPQGDLVSLNISDNLKKTGEFAAFIDGAWVPFNQKGNRFWYSIPAGTKRGRHKLVVSVSDIAGNLTRNTFHFEY